jgi:hypothetical protein
MVEMEVRECKFPFVEFVLTGMSPGGFEGFHVFRFVVLLDGIWYVVFFWKGEGFELKVMEKDEVERLLEEWRRVGWVIKLSDSDEVGGIYIEDWVWRLMEHVSEEGSWLEVWGKVEEFRGMGWDDFRIVSELFNVDRWWEVLLIDEQRELAEVLIESIQEKAEEEWREREDGG